MGASSRVAPHAQSKEGIDNLFPKRVLTYTNTQPVIQISAR